MDDGESEAGSPIEVSAVMPCLNEARTVATCVRKALASFDTLGVHGEVIVSDNGSTDSSRELAANAGARVVEQPIKGYGAALAAGFAQARGQIIIMADADDSYDWTNLGPFIDRIRSGDDIVVGNRFKGGIERGAMPWHHRYFGNPVLSALARWVYGVPIGDFHCGMRAFRKSAYDKVQPQTSGMEFATEVLAFAGRAGLTVTEIPTTLRKDGRDRPPHLRSFRDGWRHLRFMLTWAPDYLYLIPGLLMCGIGLFLQTLLAFGPVDLAGVHFGIHYLALGGLLTLTGFNVLNMCLHSKVVLSLRFPLLRSRTVTWARERFRLDQGVLLGSTITLLSLAVLVSLLVQYLGDPSRGMDASTHLAFVSAEMFALGTNIIFASFLLELILDYHVRERR